MQGEKKLSKLIQQMSPKLQEGAYIFATVPSLENIPREETICEFKEAEGITIVIKKDKADDLKLKYNFIAAWITLEVHSSLEAVGLTAVFAEALAKNQISCNVIAGYYHDHIFVDQRDAEKAVKVLSEISENYQG